MCHGGGAHPYVEDLLYLTLCMGHVFPLRKLGGSGGLSWSQCVPEFPRALPWCRSALTDCTGDLGTLSFQF